MELYQVLDILVELNIDELIALSKEKSNEEVRSQKSGIKT